MGIELIDVCANQLFIYTTGIQLGQTDENKRISG